MGKCVFLLVAALLLIGGCAGGGGQDNPGLGGNLPAGSGRPVLSVGSETITSKEVVSAAIDDVKPIAEEANDFEQFKEQARNKLEQTVTDKVSYILLYQRVRRDLGEQIDRALEREVNKQARILVANIGSYPRAEEYLRQNGEDWQSFKQSWRSAILIGWLMPKPRPITYRELAAYYDQMKDGLFAIPGAIRFQLLDIKVSEVEAAEANNRQEVARELANQLCERRRAGAGFSELEQEHRAVSWRSYPELVRPESVNEDYDILAWAEKMKAGEIAGPIPSESGEHVFVIELEEKQVKGYKPLREVQTQVAQRIIGDRQTQAANKLDEELAQQAALVERSAFVDSCLEEIWRMSKQ